jgi:formylglycine-generating enzyme required for sulfatase activity
MRFPFLLIAVLSYATVSLPAADRVALVIGNDAYPSFPEARQLTSPRADAVDVAERLRAIGFTVIDPVLDGTREKIIAAKARFLEEAKGAQMALFYFSGHGFQVGDENFLIPSDMPRITSYTVLKDHALMLRDSLMVGLEEAGAQTKVIILDCCRDNPFAAQLEKALSGTNKSLRTKGGTGEISGYGPGFYLAFATSPGTTADDGNGQRNSPFTSALLTHLKDKAGENIRDLFDEVKETVRAKSGEEQVPWTNDSLSKSHLKVLAKLNTPPGIGGLDPTPAMPIVRPPMPTPAAPPTLQPGASAAEIEVQLRAAMAEYQKNATGELKERIGQLEQALHAAPKSITATATLDDGAVGKVFELKLPGEATMKFCYCPPGSFVMGSPLSEKDRDDDEDQVRVRLTKGFWVAQTECTQAQWQALMGSNPSEFKGKDLPVEKVSWEDAQGYLSKLNGAVNLPAGWQAALPSEAQWEYACRAGAESAFSFGDALNGKQANCDGDEPYGTTIKGPFLEKTCAVARYSPNPWGLYDMHGNVWEWCADWNAPKLPGGADPTGPTTGVIRVCRSGSWLAGAARCRAAVRSDSEPGLRSDTLGFRPALVPSR